jgi:hypothetical protein
VIEAQVVGLLLQLDAPAAQSPGFLVDLVQGLLQVSNA